jgi:hypothetical protein
MFDSKSGTRPSARAGARRASGIRLVLAAAVVAGSVLATVPGDAAFASGGWSAPIAADPGQTVSSVSCPSVRFCIAVDEAGNAIIHKRNNSWEAPNPIEVGDGGLPSVSCTSTIFCMAVDGAGNVRRYSYGTWFKKFSIDSVALDAVACTKGTTCVAVDSAGDALVYGPVGWSTPDLIDSSHSLTAVSCATAAFCVAIDANGALTFNGTTWSGRSIIDLLGTLESVSCASSSLCAAVDDNGDAVSYNGAGWSLLPAIVDPGHVLTAVSCPTWGNLCVAVDNHGDAFTYDGTTWSAATTIDATNALVALSCPTVNFCVAVDASGNALTFPPPLKITTTSLPTATARHPYSATVHATGGNPPYRWLANLPRGLRINRTTGLISGTPRQAGAITITVTVRDQKIRLSHRVPSQDRASKLLPFNIS